MSGAGRMLPSRRRAHWPVEDAAALTHALAPEIGFLDRCRMAGWSPRRRSRAIQNFGRLVGFLQQEGILRDAPSLVPLLTEAHLRTFLEQERARMKLASLRNVLGDILGVLEAIAPEADWSVPRAWLRRLFPLAAREPRASPPLIHAVTLQRAGLRILCDSLDADHQVTDPLRYQLGLKLALLIACPLRIRNFASLRIGHELRRVGPGWQIELPATQTKTGRADACTVPVDLVGWLDRFIDEVRPRLLRPDRPVDALWLSHTGRPMGEQRLRRGIADATAAACGVRITPHRFRHASLTTWTLEQPEHAVLATALLGHASGHTAEQHYRIGQRQLAQQQLVRAIQNRVKQRRGA